MKWNQLITRCISICMHVSLAFRWVICFVNYFTWSIHFIAWQKSIYKKKTDWISQRKTCLLFCSSLSLQTLFTFFGVCVCVTIVIYLLCNLLVAVLFNLQAFFSYSDLVNYSPTFPVHNIFHSLNLCQQESKISTAEFEFTLITYQVFVFYFVFLTMFRCGFWL